MYQSACQCLVKFKNDQHLTAGRKEFKRAHKTVKVIDEEASPHIVFANAKQTILLGNYEMTELQGKKVYTVMNPEL